MSSFLIAVAFFASIFLLGRASKMLPQGDRKDDGWVSTGSSDASSDCSPDGGGCDGGSDGDGGGGDGGGGDGGGGD